MPRKHVPITPDELRRAFTRTYLAALNDERPNTGTADDDNELEGLDEAGELAWAKEDAVRRRTILLLLWLDQDDSADFVNGKNPLGVPNIHEIVFEVAASVPLPRTGVPKPGLFFRELEARLQAYEVLSSHD
jgi:hypothetical protein